MKEQDDDRVTARVFLAILTGFVWGLAAAGFGVNGFHSWAIGITAGTLSTSFWKWLDSE